MTFESIQSLPYPSGVEPRLDEVIEFLRITDYARATVVSPELRDQGGLPLYQAMYEHYARELDSPHYAVSRDARNNIVAAAIYSLHPEYRYANLDILAVDEQHRKQKLGHGLLEFVIEQSRRAGADSMTLTSTPEAYDFYGEHGFDDIDEDPNSDCRRMAKIIKMV